MRHETKSTEFELELDLRQYGILFAHSDSPFSRRSFSCYCPRKTRDERYGIRIKVEVEKSE